MNLSWRGSTSLEDADVVPGHVASFPDHPREFPSRLLTKAGEFLRRNEEKIKPIAHAVLVANAEGEKARGSPPSQVPLHVWEVVLRPRPRDSAVSDQERPFPR